MDKTRRSPEGDRGGPPSRRAAPGAVPGSDEEAKTRLGDYFAEVLLLDQGTVAAKARAELGWAPSHPGLPEEFSRRRLPQGGRPVERRAARVGLGCVGEESVARRWGPQRLVRKRWSGWAAALRVSPLALEATFRRSHPKSQQTRPSRRSPAAAQGHEQERTSCSTHRSHRRRRPTALAIRELIDAYAHCADRRDAEGQKALFTDEHALPRLHERRGQPSPTEDLHGSHQLTPVFAASQNSYEVTMQLSTGRARWTLEGRASLRRGPTASRHHVFTADGERKDHARLSPATSTPSSRQERRVAFSGSATCTSNSVTRGRSADSRRASSCGGLSAVYYAFPSRVSAVLIASGPWCGSRSRGSNRGCGR